MALGLQRSEDTMTVIARVRRAMPRNPDVMAICERCEGLIRAAAGKRRKPSSAEIERIREQTRLRVQRHRAKKRRNGK